MCHEPCSTLNIFNHSLNCKHRGSVKEGVLLSLSMLFWCLQVTLLHPLALLQCWSLLLSWRRARSRPRLAAGTSSFQHFITVPDVWLLHWLKAVPDRQPVERKLGWLGGHLHLRNALFSLPCPHISFNFIFGCFFYYFLNALLKHLEFYRDPFSMLLLSVLISDFWHFEIPGCFTFPLWSLLLHLDEGLILNSFCHWFVVSHCTLICWY